MEKLTNFFKESYEELKRIQWPSRRETLILTGYVIGVSLGIGLFVTAFDYIFKQLLTLILTK